MIKQLLFSSLFLIAIAAQSQNGIHFDGTDDYVDCGNDTSLQISGSYITLEAWIYPNTWTKNAFEGNIICKEYNTNNYGYMLRVGEGGKLNFALGDGSWHEITTSQILSLNTWQHIAGTFDGNKMRVYLNGNPVDSLSYTGTITATPNINLYLGAHVSYSRFYNGIIDEVRIWKKCKTESEIKAGMNWEMCGPSQDLRAYYKFNQGKANQYNNSVKKLIDLSGFANTGTLNNFTLNTSSSNWVPGKSMLKPSVYGYDTISACDKYTSPSKKYSWIKSGTYYDTIPSYNTCDSVILVQLDVRKTSFVTIYKDICDSMISPSGKAIWKTSGIYTDKIKNVANCDSVMIFHITKTGSNDTIYPATCKQYISPYGKTYTKSGFYRDTIPNHKGCDSILNIQLTIYNASTSKINRSACLAIISPSGKYFWQQPGIYYDTIPNFRKCDSILEVNFTSLKSSSTTSMSSCKPLLSPSKLKTFSTTGVYMDTITNAFGCDSVMTINFTRLLSSSKNVQIEACRTYVSPQGKTYTNSQTFTEVYSNHLGCDSTVVYNLNVIHPDVAVSKNGKVLTANSNTGLYQWLNCSDFSPINNADQKVYTANATGNYAVEINQNNCKDTSDCLFVDLTSIYTPVSNKIIKISPNPSQNQFRISFENPAKNLRIQAFDINGRCLIDETFSDTNQALIQHSLPAGTYLIRLNIDGETADGLLLVEN
jgi:hypothetical protein